MKKIAIYPGSFDPLTIGHVEIMEKAAKIFDEVYVVVCVNPSKPPATFTVEERLEMIEKSAKYINNVKIDKHFGRALDYAERVGAVAMIRGIRNTRDLENEITQYHFNHQMNRDIETVIIFPNAESLYISSSSIKELAQIKSDFRKYVPKGAYEIIKKRLCKQKVE